MRKKIAIFTILAILFTALAVWARWKTIGLGIYTLNTTIGKILIYSWRPAAVLAIISWITAVVYISAQRKKALTEPRESREEKKARKKEEKEVVKEATQEAAKEAAQEAAKEAAKEAKRNTGFCGNCGAPMKENQRFCTICGHEIGKEDAQ